MNEILKVIKERSSTRGYTAEKLTEAELGALIDAGLQAPTAANRQEIHFSVVDGENPILEEIQQEMLAGRGGSAAPAHNFYYEAPVVIILSGNAAFSWSAVDAGIAVENIALAAESLGLGNVILGCIKDAMAGAKKEHFAKALGFPEGYEYEVAIAVGRKAATKTPHEYDAAKNVTRV